MQIHEITYKRLLEDSSKLGAFMSGFGNAIQQKIAPGMQSGESSSSIEQGVAKKYNTLWNKVVATLMQSTKTTSGAQAISVKDIEPIKLKNALKQMVNQQLLADLSQRQISNYANVTRQVDPDVRQNADQIVKNIDASIDLILSVEPTKENTQKIAEAWIGLITNVNQAVQLVKNNPVVPTTPDTGVKIPSGQKLVVTHPMTNAKYFKTASGWTNEAGQLVKSATSIDYLEGLASSQPAKFERI